MMYGIDGFREEVLEEHAMVEKTGELFQMIIPIILKIFSIN